MICLLALAAAPPVYADCWFYPMHNLQAPAAADELVALIGRAKR